MASTYNQFEKNGKLTKFYRAFTDAQVEAVVAAIRAVLAELGGVIYQDGPDEDILIPFKGPDFADHLQMLAEQEGVSQYVDFLVARIRTFLADARMISVVGDSGDVSLEQWLSDTSVAKIEMNS